jgi:hypothetical protein
MISSIYAIWVKNDCMTACYVNFIQLLKKKDEKDISINRRTQEIYKDGDFQQYFTHNKNPLPVKMIPKFRAILKTSKLRFNRFVVIE